MTEGLFAARFSAEAEPPERLRALLAERLGTTDIAEKTRERLKMNLGKLGFLVERFSGVHRVGRKLATMLVSALSVPSLAPGLTPWFPDVDGIDLVVVDPNVARAVDTFNPSGSLRTYDFRERWISEAAGRIDFRSFRADLPGFSPRLGISWLETTSLRVSRHLPTRLPASTSAVLSSPSIP